MQRLKLLIAIAGEKFDPLAQKIGSFVGRRDLSARDIRALKLGGVALAIFSVFIIYKAVFPSDSATRIEVSQAIGQLNEIRAIKEEYRYSRDILAGMSGPMNEEKEALISVAEKALLRSGIDSRSFSIRGINPSVRDRVIERERAVQVNINKVPISLVLNVLYGFQKSKTILKVSDLKIKTRFDDPSLTDVSFRLSTFSFSKSG